MKCKNCKLWKSGTPGGEFDFKKTNQHWGFCLEAESEKPTIEKLFSSVCYNEEIGGELVTRDEFGCIAFTAKSKEG